MNQGILKDMLGSDGWACDGCKISCTGIIQIERPVPTVMMWHLVLEFLLKDLHACKYLQKHMTLKCVKLFTFVQKRVQNVVYITQQNDVHMKVWHRSSLLPVEFLHICFGISSDRHKLFTLADNFVSPNSSLFDLHFGLNRKSRLRIFLLWPIGLVPWCVQ